MPSCHTVQANGRRLPRPLRRQPFHNTGVPRNPNNPYYKQTNKTADPLGYNALGEAYIDYGLGDFLYPQD